MPSLEDALLGLLADGPVSRPSRRQPTASKQNWWEGTDDDDRGTAHPGRAETDDARSAVLTFVFAFPVVTMLIIGGAFGTKPTPGFDNTNPAHWYVASYLTVVIAAAAW